MDCYGSETHAKETVVDFEGTTGMGAGTPKKEECETVGPESSVARFDRVSRAWRLSRMFERDVYMVMTIDIKRGGNTWNRSDLPLPPHVLKFRSIGSHWISPFSNCSIKSISLAL